MIKGGSKFCTGFLNMEALYITGRWFKR